MRLFRSYFNSFMLISAVTFILPAVASAELSQDFINQTNSSIDTLRKRECILTLRHNNQISADKAIIIRQLRNHFGFGAATPWWPFKKAGIDRDKYASCFLRYFEWATPENEMKWEYINSAEDWENYDDADSLVNWCLANDIKVRGHCLFWNEDEKWLPPWAREITDPALFKAAMKRRIEGTVSHYKGKVAHWDAINEIIHTLQHTVEIPGMLARRSGDPDIFAWIIKSAREIDPYAKMCVNEYNVIELASDAKAYIEEIKSIESKGARIDIVGLEGHFTTYMERNSYLERIDTIVNSLPGKEFWLTEVDFNIDTSIRADKMEELMRTCFAHPAIGGLILWVWWEGNRWGGHSSFLVDSNLTENELGARWKSVRDEWRTNTEGTTNAEGVYAFRGFHGKYEASVEIDGTVYTDTFYLEPGKGAKTVELDIGTDIGTIRNKNILTDNMIFNINGKSIEAKLSATSRRPIRLSVYDLTGRLVYSMPVIIENSRAAVRYNVPGGCHILRLEAGRDILYTWRSLKYSPDCSMIEN